MPNSSRKCLTAAFSGISSNLAATCMTMITVRGHAGGSDSHTQLFVSVQERPQIQKFTGYDIQITATVTFDLELSICSFNSWIQVNIFAKVRVFLRMGHTYRHKSSLPNEFSAEDPSSHICSAVIRSTFKFALEYVTFPAAVADTYIKIKCKKQSSVCHTGILLDPILEMGGPTALCMFEPLSLQKGCRSMSHLLRSQ